MNVTLEEVNELLSEPTDVFSLTALIDSTAALEAANRLYAANSSGLRYFSELNRALPRNQAERAARELGIVEEYERLPA